ncbi:MAG: cobalamin-dependent protein, partial [Pseudomonadota bacterium]
MNIIRRILQDFGVEVIHLGHNRSVSEVVSAALQEGAQGICISSYQGGHMEYFKYARDLLDSVGCQHVKIFGGGGGVIVHEEKAELESYGISKIFHPDDGRKLGLEGMIEIIVRECDYHVPETVKPESAKLLEGREGIPEKDLGLALTNIELNGEAGRYDTLLKSFKRTDSKSPMVLGITGTGGAGKSSLVDELLHRFLNFFPGIKVGVVCVDPSKRKTGGALLGDRIRMNALSREGVFMRSVASRGSGNEISEALPAMLEYMKGLRFDLLIAESSGIGQASSKILEVSDKSLYVMTSEFGAQSQLEKIDMIDFADLIAINKADRRGAADAFRDVQKQYRRSKKLFDDSVSVPVYLTQASNFNDAGLNDLFKGIVDTVAGSSEGFDWKQADGRLSSLEGTDKRTIVPPERQSYLAEITSCVRGYKKTTEELASKASTLGSLHAVSGVLGEQVSLVSEKIKAVESELPEVDLKALLSFEDTS